MTYQIRPLLAYCLLLMIQQYQSGCDTDTLTTTVNQEFFFFYNWLCANKLRLNANKTQYCVFSNKNSNYEARRSIKVSNEVINQIGKYNGEVSNKFLGIHADKHLI